jgi:hypothetical protein
LIHGEERDVPKPQLQAVETIARVFMAVRCGTTATKELDAARQLFVAEEQTC